MTTPMRKMTIAVIASTSLCDRPLLRALRTFSCSMVTPASGKLLKLFLRGKSGFVHQLVVESLVLFQEFDEISPDQEGFLEGLFREIRLPLRCRRHFFQQVRVIG